ncbi:MAG: pirin family protein [Minisyncoccia bacterium]
MNILLHKAGERGGGNHGWLTTKYSFSFSDWYEPSRMGFGALRVLNDDSIAPSSGFPPHSHREMEIITIVTSGAVTHEDSMGNKGEVKKGDVQVMSAGTGVTHAEQNNSTTEPLALFQLWIEPNEKGIVPRYDQRAFGFENQGLGITTLVSPFSDTEGLSIHQEAYVSYASIDKNNPFTYTLHDEHAGVYVFVIEGNAEIEGRELGARDAVGISETDSFDISSPDQVKVLLVEVPFESE